jgi:hypothetical protein
MDGDNLVTDLAGTAIIAVGIVSLAESLLQVEVLVVLFHWFREP